MPDIFISYARDDDLVPPDGGKGFVTFLDEWLHYEFKDLGPDRPKIWRDTKQVASVAQFSPEIDNALRSAAFLIVILSPNWMSRPWCRKELDAFAAHRTAEGVSARERIFVVGKRHVDRDIRPELLQGQASAEFYARNDEDDIVNGDRDFFKGSVQDDRYYDNVRQLVEYLLRAIKFLKRREDLKSKGSQPISTGRTIYLAKPASDMLTAYNRLINDLVGNGFSVVPDPNGSIPLDQSATSYVDSALEQAEISIHLLGEKSGPVPEDSRSPIVQLQLERAAEKVRKTTGFGFHRLICAPRILEDSANDLAGTSERNPVDVMKKFAETCPSDKIVGDSPTDFAVFIKQHLKNIVPARSTTARNEQGLNSQRVYVYHSREDEDYGLKLAKILRERKVEPVLPVFDGPDPLITTYNSKSLLECDAVALCWASASEVWVRAQASGLRDWQKLGRSQQFAYRALIAAPPPGNRKDSSDLLFSRSEIDFILNLTAASEVKPELLDSLVPPAS
jgi:hypothetical protein